MKYVKEYTKHDFNVSNDVHRLQFHPINKAIVCTNSFSIDPVILIITYRSLHLVASINKTIYPTLWVIKKIMFKQILENYPIPFDEYTVEPIYSGLINTTWKIQGVENDARYILQKINKKIFKIPENIAYNIRLTAEYLKEKHPKYLFLSPLKTISNREMVNVEATGYFRVFPYLRDSYSVNVATQPEQAFEAARQFGMLTKLLADFDVTLLKITIPDFHDLSLRYKEFKDSIEKGDRLRVKESAEVIDYLETQNTIVQTFEIIKISPDFRYRVTHHDTKISNVLFNSSNKGLCVIDLDTLMPGFFISDVGDMMRTYLSTSNEEESDFSKIDIRNNFFKAITHGYLSEMKEKLTQIEKKHFVYAGKFMIYMQAIRFITDYINNDSYYGAKYDKQNLVRAKNQMVLLKKLIEKEPELNKIVEEYLENA